MQNGFWQKFRLRLATLVHLASWMSLAIMAAAAGLMYWASDSSWLMTLLAFGPRWAVLVPLALLVLPALLLCRRALLPLLLAGLCGLGPVMGLCLPWRALA